MLTKQIKCPSCNTLTIVTGNPGEETYITCSQCGSQGRYIFPSEKTGHRSFDPHIALEVNGLMKTYNKSYAVNNVSFTVPKGEVFGFLGPNGAGKTTTIKAILDLIRINAGEIKIRGIDVHKQGKEAKKYVGYLPEKVAFYNGLTALQNLQFYAEMKHASKEECKTLLADVGLQDSSQKKVGAFSKGMIQRLGIARAVLGNPEVLIFDEPTEGLDARGVVMVREKIRDLQKNGATVFVSSHILSEIQAVCDRVGIINKGVLVAEDTIAGLSRRLNLKPRITMTLENLSDKIVDAVKRVDGVDLVQTQNHQIEVVCDSQTKVKVILAIAKAGGNVLNFQTMEPTLEEVFMRFTEA